MRVGESSFKAKGLVYLGASDFYEGRLDGGLAAVRACLDSVDEREFFSRIFLASAWYDILPIVTLSAAAAELAGVEHEMLVTENADWLAERDINSVFRLLLKVTSPRMVALSLPRLALRYFDFGSATSKGIGSGEVEAIFSGVPAPLTDWMTWAVGGYCRRALELSNARSVAVAPVDDPVRESTVEDIDVMTLRWRLRWDD